MIRKTDRILKNVLRKVEPSEEEVKQIEYLLKDFVKGLKKEINKSKLNVEVFVGGSFAKKTLIKKDKYDVDIFLRFTKDKKSSENFSEQTHEILKKIVQSKKIKKIHGSRDYFSVKISPEIDFEIVPIKRITRPNGAENITDLSYFHVKYINRKVNKKLSHEIALAKAFCHANRFYGAESYIRGFSGYALELLVCHYKSFAKFLREVAKSKKNEKIIIDDEKHYKNKRQIMLDLNASKLESPIILIDPTYKQRNALATLSERTFEDFKEVSKEFLRNPSEKFFEYKEIDYDSIEREAKEKGYEFLMLEVKTNKQEGDIAGSKLLKFQKHLCSEINKFFEIKDEGFDYKDEKFASFYFVVDKKKKIVSVGPEISDKENIKRFKKKHNRTFTKSGRIYAEKKLEPTLKSFVKKWKRKNVKKMKEMYITNLEIISS